MIVISDTSPINCLILTGEIDILEKLFSHIIVPQAVFRELQHAKTPQRVKDWITNAPSWIEVKQADASLFTPSQEDWRRRTRSDRFGDRAKGRRCFDRRPGRNAGSSQT
jgi:predicted nucleic acid-binding protein